jgi:glycogen debranching enzyme
MAITSPSAGGGLESPAPIGADAAQVEAFFIPAANSLQEWRPRSLKHGDTFGVFDPNGDIRSGPDSPSGLFHRDTRHLSHLFLTIDGQRPLLLSSTLHDDNATLTCDLTNPDLYDAAGHLAAAHDLLHIRRTRFLWNGRCAERLVVRNFDERTRHIALELAFGADFADLFEVRGTKRERRGTSQLPDVSGNQVVLAYTGLDGQQRRTTLRFDPMPAELTAGRAAFVLDLQPRESCSLFMMIDCTAGTADRTPRDTFFADLRQARRALRVSSSRATSIATSNEIFNEGLRRSISDLYMLITDTGEGPYPYAGIPWFSATFGRDGIITALETLWLDPAIARGVLRHLAATQSTYLDPGSDAEPGKILHEARHGEMAALGEVPFQRYYGSIDSTPLFLVLAGNYLQRTGDIALLRRLWPNILAAVNWITDHGDRDGDGFIEYERRTADGLINQGWKDSHDAVFHADGSLATGPIALAEVQAYVYGAWRAAAQIARRVGHAAKAAAWDRRAEELRRAFDAAFFDEALGTYALALDGDKKPCRVRTSNAGHALWTGIALPERVPAVAQTLLDASSFCGWGIRTLASTEARYNPMSYHNGSVWPHDNALIAAGFARYGWRDEAARLFEALFAASTYIDLRRLPELLCGFPRQRSRGPTFYPVSCSPQAWSAAAPLYMLQSCLGLGFDVDRQLVAFDTPTLPSFVDEVILRNLVVGEGSVDLALRRSGRQVLVDILDRNGQVRVVTEN